MRLDPERHEVEVRGEQVRLPLKEFELLEILLANAGRVLPRETLIDRVWGADYVGDTKTLDVHIKRLRTKVEDDPSTPDADRHDPGPRLQVRHAPLTRIRQDFGPSAPRPAAWLSQASVSLVAVRRSERDRLAAADSRSGPVPSRSSSRRSRGWPAPTRSASPATR